ILYALFTFITLPCEYNASSRAKKQLVECDILTQEETNTAAKVLSCAAKTYLISFFMSLAQVARILLILLSARNRSNRN
ncbi:MAG: zinc metallopeptidase, partial [Clostridia bacterium]|nr:zinc metallopeptidase [Clostridia bacterium]